MIQMRKCGWHGMACAGLAFVAALCVAAAGLAANGPEPRFFRIGTAATGGSFFEIGGVVASAISSPQGGPPCGHGGSCGVLGLVAVAQATPGSIENLRMINNAQIDSGFAQADLAAWAQRSSRKPARSAGYVRSQACSRRLLILSCAPTARSISSPI
jgi:TRAP-type uncharacterized transport system substrate-binding protein